MGVDGYFYPVQLRSLLDARAAKDDVVAAVRPLVAAVKQVESAAKAATGDATRTPAPDRRSAAGRSSVLEAASQLKRLERVTQADLEGDGAVVDLTTLDVVEAGVGVAVTGRGVWRSDPVEQQRAG